jgi:uncharacterized RDD family membrane protein YckC
VTPGGVSPVPREARPYQGRRAGLVTRLVASVVDACVVVALLGGGYVAFAGLVFMVDPLGFRPPDPAWVLGLAWALTVLVVYLTAAWCISGRTYGCHVMGIRVLGPRGGRLGVPGALVRATLCAVLPVGLLWCAVNRQHRSLQDLLLRTSVVYDWQPRDRASSAAGG